MLRRKLKHKFNARRTRVGYIKFPSMLEKKCWDALQTLKKSKEILFFLRQVPFDLPGGRKHFVDFEVFTEEDVYFIESKGRDLPIGKLKREICEDLFKIKIHVVNKPLEIFSIIRNGEKDAGQNTDLVN